MKIDSKTEQVLAESLQDDLYDLCFEQMWALDPTKVGLADNHGH
ncbi:hypothetical protein [Bosea sp. NBC_00550]|nr:hypothetical protein [Bosea sp. NBC_00550]UZF93189.1 hypothetical protein NWE53_02950 [Bosea sp. NBC_00550]